MISILLATYNGEKFIKESIDSVLNQTFNNFELLIGFNGTTDKSKDIVKKYNDKRIKIFDFAEDKGKAKTLNKLLSFSKYDWVCLQDDDDVWVNNKLESQVKFTNKNYDVIGTHINYINSNGDIIGYPNLATKDDHIKKMCLNGINQIANSSVMIKKSSIIDINGWNQDLDKLFDEGYQPLEDFDMWIRLIKINKKFINIDSKLVNHRIHKTSNCNTKKFDLSKIL